MQLLSILIAAQSLMVADTLPQRVVEIDPVMVVAKQFGHWHEQPVAVTSVNMRFMENNRINAPKELSLIAPNFYAPDYGSKMTSSMYVRGIGSRMEQPALGLYVDNIPIMNKNSYDFNFLDIATVDMLRGPHGTLYGRNTIGGILNIRTLSPMDYQGTRYAMDYSSGNTALLRLSTFQLPSPKFGYSISVVHDQSDGFYTNEYTGKKCDDIVSDEIRFRTQWKLSSGWAIDNTLKIGLLEQNGFAYSIYDESNGTSPINHNDPCTYDRFSLVNGTTISYRTDKYLLSSTTSYQYLDDKMVLDQDFTPKSMFTLAQSQKEHALTQEIVVKSHDDKKLRWITGLFGFYRHNRMNAPVNFKQDGINDLILSNANNGIHTAFPDANLLIQESSFPIESKFKLPALGVSAYHQSELSLGDWILTAGLRLDYENTTIKYNNNADINYRLTLTMPEYKKISTMIGGKKNKSFLEVMPRLSVMRKFDKGNLYGTVARGYKTGGFNTQIFSEIIQSGMMNNIMNDLGVHWGDGSVVYDVNTAISYKPEYSWNYELGGHFDLFKSRLSVDAALFYIDIDNQQLTVFPPGKSTGRMMSNAGKSRSMGGEITVNYNYDNLTMAASYGYTDARFISYIDGVNDYQGKRIPYVPTNTMFGTAEYRFNINSRWIDRLAVQLNLRGVGKIYWNESNEAWQDFYSLVGGAIRLERGAFVCSLWGKNITDTHYNTFYFRSMGNSLVQRGKPAQFGISVAGNF